MKKLVAALTAMILLLAGPLSALAASADGAYVFLLYALSQDDAFGSPLFSSKEEAGFSQTVLCYDFTVGSVLLTGYAADGAYTATAWLSSDDVLKMSSMMAVLMMYEDISAMTSNGLVIMLNLVEDGDPIYISSADEATAMVAIINAWLEN